MKIFKVNGIQYFELTEDIYLVNWTENIKLEYSLVIKYKDLMYKLLYLEYIEDYLKAQKPIYKLY